MDVREDRAWLLRNRFSPFPIAGRISLTDGVITFTLDAEAADASLGWLESALETDGLEERIRSGEEVVVFSAPLGESEVSWPITGGGAMMIVEEAGRRWVISHDYAVGGAVLQTLNIITGRGRARTWKRALAAAERERDEPDGRDGSA